MTETFNLSSIKPNPFRHMDRYPIQEAKIVALQESISTTGFWDNLVARIDIDGKPQIAYGHHRLHALRKEYAPSHKVHLIVRDLSDDLMLKIMARENLEEWGTSAAVEQETVRAVVEAYADGLIELGKMVRDTAKAQVRHAPGFIQGDPSAAPQARPYTGQQVANYLGWDITKVSYALGALELIDEELLTESDFDGLGTEAAKRVVQEARKAKRDRQIREREQRKAAETARKAKEKAERDRAAAQELQAQRKAQAAAARKDTDLRARREAEARQAAEEARQAKQEWDRQQRAQQAAEKRAEQAKQDARKEGQRAGKQASVRLKSGSKGHADPNLVDPSTRKHDTPPPDIDAFAERLAARLNKVMDPDFDDRAKELDRVLTYRQHLSSRAARELDIVLGRIIERVAASRSKLGVDPRTENTINVEIIETKEITQ